MNIKDKIAQVLLEKEQVRTIKEGSTYAIPVFTIVDRELFRTDDWQEINILRGAGDVKNDGVLHQGLISLILKDLRYKNEIVPSRETSLTITKLEEALNTMRQRDIDRIKRNVDVTHKE